MLPPLTINKIAFCGKILYYYLMTIRYIIRLAALAASIYLLATMNFRRKKIQESLGSCLLELTRKTTPVFWAAVVLIPLFIAALWLRTFDLYVEVILCATAVLAAVIVTRERNYGMLSGIWDNALIVDGRLLKKENIASFPTFDYEEDEDAEPQDEIYRRALKIVTEDIGVVYVGFADEDEKNAACKILKDWL